MDDKNKDDDRAGLIHQIASPLAETLPRPDRLESVRDRIRMEGYRAPRVQGSLAERMAFLNGIDFAVFCINQELSNPVETVSPPLSEASRSVPSASAKTQIGKFEDDAAPKESL